MEKINIPRLRFNEFNGEWKKTSLSRITVRKDNKRIPVKSGDRPKGSTPYYGANGIQGYIDGFTHTGYNVLIAEDGANDISNYPVILTKGNIWVNNHAHVLSAKEDLSDNVFLSYALKKVNFYKYLVGSSRYKLNSATLMKINLNICDFKEQQKIGSFISKLDKLIEFHDKKLEQLKDLKIGYLQKMFPKDGEKVPRLRFNGFSEEWKEEGLLNLVKIRTGSRNAKEALEKGKYVFFDRSSEIKYLNDYDFDDQVIVYAGEGAKFLPRKFNGKYSLHQRAYGIYDFNKINFEFLYQELLNKNNHFLKYAVGTTAKSLRKDCFERLIIKYPSFDEQQRIGSFLSKLDRIIEDQSEKIDSLKQQKKAYLQKMFV